MTGLDANVKGFADSFLDAAKEDQKLYVYELHALHPNLCKTLEDGTQNENCVHCNSDERQVAMRDVQRAVVGCHSNNKVRLYSNYHETRNILDPTWTGDGVHYTGDVQLFLSQKIINAMCDEYRPELEGIEPVTDKEVENDERPTCPSEYPNSPPSVSKVKPPKFSGQGKKPKCF